MTPDEIAAARARADKATKGPWIEHELYPGEVRNAPDRVWRPISEVACEGHDDQDKADATFIAAARTDVPMLLDEVERLGRELKEAKRHSAHLNDLLALHIADVAELTQNLGDLRTWLAVANRRAETALTELARSEDARGVWERAADKARAELSEANRLYLELAGRYDALHVERDAAQREAAEAKVDVRRATLYEAAELCDVVALRNGPDNHLADNPRAAYQSGAAKCAWELRAAARAALAGDGDAGGDT